MIRRESMPQRLLESAPGPGRLGSLYDAMLERMTDDVVRWRSLAVLFFVGGLLADSSLLLPTWDAAGVLALALIGSSAVVSGVVMFVFAGKLPNALMTISLAFGTALVTGGVIATQDTSAIYALFYVWVGF